MPHTPKHLIFLAFLLVCASAAAGADRRPLIFGFLPFTSTERLVTRFGPLVDYLSQRSGREIRMETAPDFRSFVERTRDGRRYDLLFTAPHLFWLALQEPGYRGLVRVDLAGMTAVVVAPVDSDIRTLSDLRGRTVATTGPLALSTLLVRDQLVRAGLDPDADVNMVATPSHIAALLSSRQGTTQACAVMRPVFHRARAKLRESMRIVAESAPVPHIPIGVAPWVDSATAERLRSILIGMRDDPQGRAILAQLDWPGFVAQQPHDYDSVRPLAEQIESR
jgi:phosphonate transport system substrate-binding protein